MAYQFIQDAYQTKRGAVGRRGCLMCAAKAVPSMYVLPKGWPRFAAAHVCRPFYRYDSSW